ncbi:MAG: hypothetical protein CM1200mP34_1360 [Verrucomicrobiales bacterium]|nr:MAG: hypothetical protein CM1200mP34_1360 [Verrucomicrobiales bacterium]
MSEYDSIVFKSPEWLPVALGVSALVILVSLWGYGRARLPMHLKVAGITLKTLGIALLCFCLLEPELVQEKAKPGANFIAVLADNSQGMAIRDAGSTTSRAEELVKALKLQRATGRRHSTRISRSGAIPSTLDCGRPATSTRSISRAAPVRSSDRRATSASASVAGHLPASWFSAMATPPT